MQATASELPSHRPAPSQRIRTTLSAPIAWIAASLFLLAAAAPAWAHRGPPFPILQNHRVGPLNVSVWSNPDVGNGLFYVLVDPPRGSSVPSGLKVKIAVQPLSKRLPEKTYDAYLVKHSRQYEYKAVVPFDKVEMWRVRVLLAGPSVSGEADVNVRTMPSVLGRWDLILFVLPFVAIALLWLRAAAAKRKRIRNAMARAGSGSAPPGANSPNLNRGRRPSPK